MATLKNTVINDTGFMTLPVGNTAQRPASPVNGMMRYNTTTGGVDAYVGNAWVNMSSPLGSATNPASSVTVLKGSGQTTDGLYWFTQNGVTYQAYCLMSNTYDSGGWVLLYNIDTTQASSALGGLPSYDNTTWWTTANESNQSTADPTTTNVKTRAYDNQPISELLIIVNARTGYSTSSIRGYAVYVNANYSGQTYMAITTGGTNRILSSAGRKVSNNYVGNLSWNNRRSQNRGGDPFIDTTVNGYNNGSDNLMINATSAGSYSWGNDNGQTRLTTTAGYNNTSYGHTAAGVGINHYYNTWQWTAAYAPITAYCEPPAIYGSTTLGVNYGTWSSYSGYNQILTSCNNLGWANGTISCGISVFAR